LTTKNAKEKFMKDNVDPSLYDKIMKDMPEVIEGDSFIT